MAGDGLLRRGARALREDGLGRELLWRALAEVGYRRLWVIIRPLAGSEHPWPADLELRELTTENVPAYRAARPDTPEMEVLRRLRRGFTCALLYRGAAIVAGRWASVGVAEVDYLGLEIELPHGFLHHFDGFTVATEQRHGHQTVLREMMLDQAFRAGHCTQIYMVHPENHVAVSMRAPTTQVLGKLASLRIGTRSWPLPAPRVRAVLGAIRPRPGQARRGALTATQESHRA
jgi:hypothetical protein